MYKEKRSGNRSEKVPQQNRWNKSKRHRPAMCTGSEGYENNIRKKGGSVKVTDCL